MSDFLDYVKDLQQGKTTISPDELAPELEDAKIAGNIEYDEEKDPEVMQEARYFKQRRLQEAVRSTDAITKWLQTSKDASWDAFQKAGLAKKLEMTEEKYTEKCNWLIKKQGVDPMADNWPQKVGRRSQYAAQSGAAAEKKVSGPYDMDREEGYQSDNADLASLAKEYGDAPLKGTAEETFNEVFNIVYNILVGRSDKRHACIAGDPGIGKTFLVTEVCHKYIGQHPTKAQLVYEAGDIGSNMSSLVAFFYYHSKNKVIVLDDNDKMIMSNLGQDVMNVVKALLDPKAAEEKPITVRASILKAAQQRLEDIMEPEEMNESQDVFEIDQEALRENIFRLRVNGQLVVDKHVSLNEAREIEGNMMRLREDVEPTYVNPFAKFTKFGRIQEAGKSNKEFLEDLVDGEEEDEELERRAMARTGKGKRTDEEEMAGDDGEKSTFPRRFLFDSSVIFISNLSSEQLNTAVLDRVELVEVKLTLDQFLERLGSIYKGLCKGSKYSSVPQELRDWAKKCVYTALGIVIEAWKSNTALFGTAIEINRKLTFRFFDECVVAWMRYAYDRAERTDAKDIMDATYRNKLGRDLLPEIIRRKMIPAMKQVVK